MDVQRANQRADQPHLNGYLQGKSVSRRRILSGASSVVIALSGCMDTTEPGAPATQEEESSSTSSTELGETLQSNLIDSGINVDSATYTGTDETVELKYVSANPDSQDVLTNEIGTITGEFYNSLGDGLDAERLNATILNSEGIEQVTWHAKKEWYDQLQNGELEADELTLRVLNTVEEV